VFSPATTLPALGGEIEITVPPLFDYISPTEYPSDKSGFSCAVEDDLLAGLTTVTNSDKVSVHYGWVATEQDLGPDDVVTIKCLYWRNPITPTVIDGFKLKTLDLNGAQIDETQDSFALDATDYGPLVLRASDIEIDVDRKDV